MICAIEDAGVEIRASGALADWFGRKYLLLFGFSFLICANVIFMTSTSTIGMISGYFLVGLHMSMTQCNLKALVSTTIPNNMRGSAFSIVGLATGSCLFLGNIMLDPSVPCDWFECRQWGCQSSQRF